MQLRLRKTFGLLHIDPAYTLTEARRRGHVNFFLARSASKLFARVWSVHPIADAAGASQHRIDIFSLWRGHGVVEGKAELCRMPAPLRPLNLLISQFVLYRLLVRLVRSQKLAIVVAVDPFICGVLGLAVARRTRRPFVVRISGNHDEIYSAARALAHPRIIPTFWLQKAIGRFILKRADLVAAINRNNLGYAIANGARHTAIIPISGHIEAIHRIDPDERKQGKAALERLGVAADASILLYFGRLIDLKHPDDALRAMASVIEGCPGTQGIIAGSGEMAPRLIALAAELGVAHAVHFVGQLDQETLSQIIPHCIILSPSAGQMAVLESALGGAPIVAYDRDFQPEFIEDGIDGFVVSFRDWRAMAARAAQIAADPKLFARLSGHIRRKALEYMDPQRVKTAEWSAYSKVLDIPGFERLPPQA